MGSLTFGEAAVGNLNTARMFMAYCDNCLDEPAAASVRAWVLGGYDAAGARLTSIERWDPTAGTSTNMASVLPTATADAGSCTRRAGWPAKNEQRSARVPFQIAKPGCSCGSRMDWA